jgi:16S rRNA (guanine527-N7)-methyltransferase
LAVDDASLREFFGAAYESLAAYAELLADEGVTRGLIGPREVPRLWERHLLNSAAVAPLVPQGVVVDVGSGAGLPGVVLSAMRPDVHVLLVESMLRRSTWLEEVVRTLGLEAEVRRSRAEDLHGQLLADAVTARAVAPLDRLVGWTLPLLKVGGQLLALKGSQAADEVRDASETIARHGGGAVEVLDVGTLPGVETTRVVRVVKQSEGRIGGSSRT